jgi:hypothetical protein
LEQSISSSRGTRTLSNSNAATIPEAFFQHTADSHVPDTHWASRSKGVGRRISHNAFERKLSSHGKNHPVDNLGLSTQENPTSYPSISLDGEANPGQPLKTKGTSCLSSNCNSKNSFIIQQTTAILQRSAQWSIPTPHLAGRLKSCLKRTLITIS